MLHIGCNTHILKEFINYDYNVFIFANYIPFLPFFLSKLNFFPKPFIDFIYCAKTNNIKYCNASIKIPHKNSTIDIIYSCHMIQHLDWAETLSFFNEALRVLKDNGILRIVIPDSDNYINDYNKERDIDNFVRKTWLVAEKPKTIIKKLQYLIQGHVWHHQLFTKKSIKKFKKLSFRKVLLLDPGKTAIPFKTSIDLKQRAGDSLYFEFIK